MRLSPVKPGGSGYVEPEAQGYLKIKSPDEVVARFSQEIHLYVVPDDPNRRFSVPSFPVPEEQLRLIADYLQPTNYYLVIIARAEPYTHKSRSNVRLTGKDAVKTMLGQDLFDSAAFAGIINNEMTPPIRSASLLLLTLDPHDRYWWMSTSALHEMLGITDEADWTNRSTYGLIALPDFKEGRFFEGIKNTVSTIDADLEKRIREWHEHQDRSRLQAASLLRQVDEKLTEYQSRLASVSASFPDRSGDLVRPLDVPQLSQEYERAKTALNEQEYGRAWKLCGELSEILEKRLAALVAYPKVGDLLDDLAMKLGQAESDDYIFVAREELELAKDSVNTVVNAWSKGESQYEASLEDAQRKVRDLMGALAKGPETYSLDGEHITDLLADANELSRSEFGDAAHRELNQVTEKLNRAKLLWASKDEAYLNVLREAELDVNAVSLKIGAAKEVADNLAKSWRLKVGATLLTSLFLGVLGKVRLRQVKVKAEEAKDKLGALRDEMDSCEDRLNGLYERHRQAHRSPQGSIYEFPSDSRSTALLNEAFEALGRASRIQDVLKRVCGHAGAMIKRGGILRPKDYDAAIAIMGTASLELIVQRYKRSYPALAELVSDLAKCSAQAEKHPQDELSVKSFLEESRGLLNIAKTNLDRFQLALEQRDVNLSNAQSKLNEIEGGIKAPTENAQAPGHELKLFGDGELEGAGLCAIKEKLAWLLSQKDSDPVLVCDQAKKLCETLEALAGAIDQIKRYKVLGTLHFEKMFDALSGAGLSAAWVAATAVSAMRKSVRGTRQQVAKILSLDEAAVMQDGADNPDNLLDKATYELGKLKTALDSGGQERVDLSLRAIKKLACRAALVADETVRAARGNPDRIKSLSDLCDNLEKRIPALEVVLREMTEKYTSSALETIPEGAVSKTPINTNIATASAHILSVRQDLSSAINLGAGGQILAARRLLDQADQARKLADNCLQEIVSMKTKLEQIVRENAEKVANLLRVRTNIINSVLSQRGVRVATSSNFEKLNTEVLALDAGQLERDPFDANRRLIQLEQAFGSIEEASALDVSEYNFVLTMIANAERTVSPGNYSVPENAAHLISIERYIEAAEIIKLDVEAALKRQRLERKRLERQRLEIQRRGARSSSGYSHSAANWPGDSDDSGSSSNNSGSSSSNESGGSGVTW
jgi:hypothetical protein